MPDKFLHLIKKYHKIIRRILYANSFRTLFIISATIYIFAASCSNKHSHGHVTNEQTQQINYDAILYNNHYEHINLPFGCAGLNNLTYPMHWEADPENYGHLKQPADKTFDEVYTCFETLNNQPTLDTILTIHNLQYVNIGSAINNITYIDTLAQRNIDSLKYRLPNVRNYQCYYYYTESTTQYGKYGNILLLDNTTHNGKVLNIYNEIGGDQNVSYRYFYLTNESLIIYEGACYDDGCSLNKKWKILISEDGEINITDAN